jgi:hypothetical protein
MLWESTRWTDNNADRVYERLVDEYHWALAACETGDGDFDTLWLRWEAARQALDVYVKSLKREEHRPVHQTPIRGEAPIQKSTY